MSWKNTKHQVFYGPILVYETKKRIVSIVGHTDGVIVLEDARDYPEYRKAAVPNVFKLDLSGKVVWRYPERVSDTISNFVFLLKSGSTEASVSLFSWGSGEIVIDSKTGKFLRGEGSRFLKSFHPEAAKYPYSVLYGTKEIYRSEFKIRAYLEIEDGIIVLTDPKSTPDNRTLCDDNLFKIDFDGKEIWRTPMGSKYNDAGFYNLWPGEEEDTVTAFINPEWNLTICTKTGKVLKGFHCQFGWEWPVE